MTDLRAKLVVAGAILAASGAGCSGSMPSPDATTNDVVSADTPDVGADATPSDTRPPDAQTDVVAAGDAPPVDLSCLGDSIPLTLSDDMPFASVAVGASSSPSTGAFLIDFATTASAIDLAAFGATAPASSGCDAAELGQYCQFANLDFFGPWGSVTLITENLSGLGGGVTEAGIIGTDFLSRLALTLDYPRSLARRAVTGTLCADSVLLAAGFAPLSVHGFYTNDTHSLEPLTDVDTAGASGETVPNVPTIPIRLGGTAAIAQIDSGFDDSLTSPAINIDVALFDALEAAEPDALVRDAARDLSLSTCIEGVSEPVEAYDLASGFTLDFVATDATVAVSFPNVFVFVKRTPAAAAPCGGIGTWTVPAAQIAASFLRSIGTSVFDPFSARVWVATRAM